MNLEVELGSGLCNIVKIFLLAIVKLVILVNFYFEKVEVELMWLKYSNVEVRSIIVVIKGLVKLLEIEVI